MSLVSKDRPSVSWKFLSCSSRNMQRRSEVLSCIVCARELWAACAPHSWRKCSKHCVQSSLIPLLVDKILCTLFKKFLILQLLFENNWIENVALISKEVDRAFACHVDVQCKSLDHFYLSAKPKVSCASFLIISLNIVLKGCSKLLFGFWLSFIFFSDPTLL